MKVDELKGTKMIDNCVPEIWKKKLIKQLSELEKCYEFVPTFEIFPVLCKKLHLGKTVYKPYWLNQEGKQGEPIRFNGLSMATLSEVDE